MSRRAEPPPTQARFPTGVVGVDQILGGGLFKACIYIATGLPGSGKTIFANQICFNYAKTGHKAVYVTLLAENHSRMLSQLGPMSFFDTEAVGNSITYLNGYGALEAEGFQGLLELIRNVIREHHADFLVLDGMVGSDLLPEGSNDYKKFINALQTWVGVVGCTVLILTSSAPGRSSPAPNTMVDGIFEFATERMNVRSVRQFSVAKFRGSGFVEGAHHYALTSDGIKVWPRVEAAIRVTAPVERGPKRISSGVTHFDELISGGYAEKSTTLLLGPSGAGKTLWGMHFLSEGLENREPGLHFGFFENPPTLARTGNNLGLHYDRAMKQGLLRAIWHKASEQVLDQLGYELLEDVRARGVKRLFIDGLVGFKEAMYPERIAAFFSVLTEELARLGVTTLISEETRELFVREVQIPTPGASAAFENIIYLRLTDAGPSQGRLVSVMKTRDAEHSRNAHLFEVLDDEGIVVDKNPQPARDLSSSVSVTTGVGIERDAAPAKKRKLFGRGGRDK